MKKCVVFLLISCLFAGCAAEPTFETIADDWVQSAAAPMGEVLLALPEEAAAPVSESGNAALYQCAGYDLLVQTLAAGDLDATIRAITGHSREDLTVMQTQDNSVRRYDLVWSCLGESGEQVCRACVLDDGNYHYVLTALADADQAGEFEEVWEEIFSAYSLG